MSIFESLFGGLLQRRRNSKTYTAEKCGHKTQLAGQVMAYDEFTTTQMPLNDHGTTDWCLDCIGKMAIRCAWCGKPIFIGDPVTLYTPVSKETMFEWSRGQHELDFGQDMDLGLRIPKGIAIYGRNPLQLVGCLRMTCADSGADRAGFWVPGADGKGTVERVLSPIEQIFDGGAKEMIIVSNLADRSKAVPVTTADKKLLIPAIRIIE